MRSGISFRPVAAALAFGLAAPPCGAEVVPASQAQMQMSFAPLVRAGAPAAVNIYATRFVPDHVSPFASDPFF